MLDWKREDKYFFEIKPFENKDWDVSAIIINGEFKEFLMKCGTNSLKINSKDGVLSLKQIIDVIYEKSGLSSIPSSEDQRMVDLK